MAILKADCMQRFIRVCDDGWNLGWHERNSGNLSYRLDESDLLECQREFSITAPGDHEWHETGVEVGNLAGEYFLVTGAGKFLHNVSWHPQRDLGIVKMNDTGTAWRIVWGLSDGGRPTSEFYAHLKIHSVRRELPDVSDRVVYHAHCPHIIALSTLIEPDARTWSRILWKCMTESILIFPEGVSVLPWMVAGGPDIAQATAEELKTTDACVWTQHGIISSGKDFAEAFGLINMMEKSAGLYLEARMANGGAEPPHLVSDAQLLKVCAAFNVKPHEGFLDAAE